MQTADIAKSTQCWCERISAADSARSAPLPLMPFSARSAPFSAPLTLRSHALIPNGMRLFVRCPSVFNVDEL